jgi:hypothetical protein
MGVDVGVGVDVGTGVGVALGAAVGVGNCPRPQPNMIKLVTKTRIAAVRFFLFIFSCAVTGAPGFL